MPLIFLDIDGVLNDHSCHSRTRYCSTDKACIARLDRILVETDARIVLTSAWRYLVHGGSMTMEGLRNLLHSHWVDGSRLIGITRRDVTDGIAGVKPRTDRGPQVTEWLRERVMGDPFLMQTPYVVIDDMDLEITTSLHPFVRTDGSVGLTKYRIPHNMRVMRRCPDTGRAGMPVARGSLPEKPPGFSPCGVSP